MSNKLIRETAKHEGVKLWQIAEEMGMAEATFSRKMRHEFTAELREQALDAIKRLAAEKGAANDADN